MLGSLILYLKGMRIMMFQLSGLYCRGRVVQGFRLYPEGPDTLALWSQVPKPILRIGLLGHIIPVMVVYIYICL